MRLKIPQRVPDFGSLLERVLSTAAVFLAPVLGNAQTCANPAPLPTPNAKWEVVNRLVSAEGGVLRQDYVEYDASGAAPDGVLDHETGRPPVGAVTARWQGHLQFLPLWVQLRSGRVAGQTDYRGFLQQENTLTPYNNARTGNVMLDVSVRFGLPFAIYPRWQIVPFVDYGWRRWQRDLAQYRETFHHQSASGGVLVQFQPTPKWMLEAEASTGRTTHVELAVPAFSFKGSLGSVAISQLGLGGDYWLSGQFSVGLRWSQARYRYGASPIINGLQEPDSHTSQKMLAVRAAYHY